MKKYNHSFANYPTGFKGCVVSPTKICLQFLNPEIKLRVNPNERHLLPKQTDNDVYLPVPEHGIQIEVTAVGCQMPVVEEYQKELIEAYKKYYRTYAQTYKDTYNKNFKDFLLQIRAKLTILIDEISKRDNPPVVDPSEFNTD